MSEDNLAKMLNSMIEVGICVIKQDTHEILYFNNRIKEINSKIKLGMKCHEILKGSCKDCPLIEDKNENFNHTIHYDVPFGKAVDIVANKIVWDGNIPAFVLTMIPHKLNYEEEKGLAEIERMYTQSLVTVFNECIIANLSLDYYVNCQKDTLWTDIPSRGRFGIENKHYSQTTIHPDDLEMFDAYFSRESMLRIFKEGKKQISKRLRRRMDDGTYHMVEFTAVRIDRMNEDEYWCVLVYRDINDEYLQEKQMNLEISQLATAARIAYQMLIAVNLTKNTYYMMEYDNFFAKKAAESGTFDELVKVGVSTLAPEFREEFIRKFSRENLLEAYSNGVQKVTMEMRQMGDDGVYHWNSTQAVRVHSSHTDDVIEITMCKSIDEERRQQEERLEKERKTKMLLEETLQKAQDASRAKSDFMSKMSHDIRTPMNAIMGMTALAQVNIDDKEKLKDYLNKIEVSGSHLLGLINEVLDVSKIESGKSELVEMEFDLYDVIEDTVLIVQPAIQKKNQVLNVNIIDGIHSKVWGDEQKLRQVLVNILENASKYTENQGKISLSLDELKKEEIYAGTYQFVIEDTGIGMKKEYIEHIFEPFTRADDTRISKIAGTGLGMTVVWNIVNMMGGEIKVDSEYGKGSKFTVTLCLVKKDSEKKSDMKKIDVSMENFNNMRILLVEDNELNQQIASEMLELLGVKIEIVENGMEAVKIISEKPAFYYDLVFMDIQMPVMNGYEATERIRNLDKVRINELPIIAMTADAFSEDIKKAGLSGMNGHLAKPIDMNSLRSTLEKCIQWKHKNNKKDDFFNDLERN